MVTIAAGDWLLSDLDEVVVSQTFPSEQNEIGKSELEKYVEVPFL